MSFDTTSIESFKNTYIKQTLTSFNAGDHVLNLIINKGTDAIYGHYLAKKIPKHNSEFIAQVFEEVAAQEVRAYDPGESIDALIANWGEEEEPDGTPLDSWARLAAKMIQPEVESSSSEPIGSRNTVDSRKSLFRRKIGSAKNIKKIEPEDPKKKKETPKKEEIDVKFYKVPGFERYVDDDEESCLLRQEREDQRKLKAEEIIEAKQKIIDDKLKEEKKRNLERMVKDKEYTFDYDGSPVFLTRVIPQTKTPNKESYVPEFDLEHSLKVLKSLPDEPPVREDKKEDSKKNTLSLTGKKDGKGKREGEEYLLPVVGDFAQLIEIKPGVRAEINSQVKMGPDVKDPNKMKRADYMKNLEERRNEKLGQYKRQVDSEVGEAPALEEEENAETRMNKLIEAQLRQLGSLDRLTEVEIHEQEKFIQMLLDDAIADPRLAVEERKRREKILKKIEQMKEDSENAKRAYIIENRITNYKRQLSGLPAIDPPLRGSERPSTVLAKNTVKPNKIQKAFDAFNRKLLGDDAWDQSKQVVIQPQTPPSKMPKVSSVEKKSAMKTAIFGTNHTKEPRDRVTPAQKKLMEIRIPVFNSPAHIKPETMKEKGSARVSSPDMGGGKYALRSSFTKTKGEEGFKGDRTNDSITQEKTKIIVRNTSLKLTRQSINTNVVNHSIDTKLKK